MEIYAKLVTANDDYAISLYTCKEKALLSISEDIIEDFVNMEADRADHPYNEIYIELNDFHNHGRYQDVIDYYDIWEAKTIEKDLRVEYSIHCREMYGNIKMSKLCSEP